MKYIDYKIINFTYPSLPINDTVNSIKIEFIENDLIKFRQELTNSIPPDISTLMTLIVGNTRYLVNSVNYIIETITNSTSIKCLKIKVCISRRI